MDEPRTAAPLDAPAAAGEIGRALVQGLVGIAKWVAVVAVVSGFTMPILYLDARQKLDAADVGGNAVNAINAAGALLDYNDMFSLLTQVVYEVQFAAAMASEGYEPWGFPYHWEEAELAWVMADSAWHEDALSARCDGSPPNQPEIVQLLCENRTTLEIPLALVDSLVRDSTAMTGDRFERWDASLARYEQGRIAANDLQVELRAASGN